MPNPACRERGRLVVATTVVIAVFSLTGAVRPRAQTTQQPARQTPLPSVRLNHAIEMLEMGKPIFGILSNDRSLENARVIAASGADFVITDMEHGIYDSERLQIFLLGMINKAEIARKGNLQPDVTPMVRTPQYSYEPISLTIKQALDIGVMGIMFSAVSNKDQVLAVVSASRYPQPVGSLKYQPLGRRGNGPTAATWLWGVSDYAKRADLWPLDRQGEILLFLQIETWEGCKVNEILDVPGVGAIFIGPSDLGLSLIVYSR